MEAGSAYFISTTMYHKRENRGVERHMCVRPTTAFCCASQILFIICVCVRVVRLYTFVCTNVCPTTQISRRPKCEKGVHSQGFHEGNSPFESFGYPLSVHSVGQTLRSSPRTRFHPWIHSNRVDLRALTSTLLLARLAGPLGNDRSEAATPAVSRLGRFLKPLRSRRWCRWARRWRLLAIFCHFRPASLENYVQTDANFGRGNRLPSHLRVSNCCTRSRGVQPIPLGVTFSKALPKLKAQSSNVSFHWNVAKETFELWALSFRKWHTGGIGCTWSQGPLYGVATISRLLNYKSLLQNISFIGLYCTRVL